jgi:hypothetical protein
MTQVTPPVWQASEAQSRLGELVDAALDGAPQVVRRADGREVVVVARAVFEAPADAEAPKETLKDVLLNRGFTLEEDDPFFTYLEEARGHAAVTFDPSPGGEAFLNDVYPGHQSRKRSDKTKT